MLNNINKIEQKSRQMRFQILEMIAGAQKGHIGGAFSCVDIIVALYYGDILKYYQRDPQWDGRDRFILSKGHSCEALYAVLADVGFFPIDELHNYQKKGCCLGGHPDKSIPGVEADTGSLGHGLGIGAGIALSAKMDKKEFLTFVLMGDGECCEGSVWEAGMFAAKHNLNNLIGIIDNNGLCVTDNLENCTSLDPLDEKWRAFGWEVKKVDGHSIKDILSVFSQVRTRDADKPLMIIAKTVKGKGVSFMENNHDWHHGVPKGEVLEQAREELRKSG